MEPWPGDSSPNYKPERGSYEVGHANPRMSSAEFTTDILISIADNIPEDLSLDLAIELLNPTGMVNNPKQRVDGETLGRVVSLKYLF